MAKRPYQNGNVIAYVAARLPELSETFVYREFLGLRARGLDMIPTSVRAPHDFPCDPALAELRRETFVIYGWRTWLVVPIALLCHPLLMGAGCVDALRSDHDGVASRMKHLYQAMMGISAGWRLRNRGIGHIHAHMASVPTSLALYMARALGISFSFTGHAADLFVNRAALRFKLKNAAFTACISHWHRAFYQQVIPIETSQLPIIRCGVEIPDMIAPANREIVTVARLVQKKGIDLLLQAFSRLQPDGWTLRILGDGPERYVLEKLASDLDIADKVVWEGAQPHAACLAAIRHAGIFVLPCRTAGNGDKDGIPVVLMEAMAAARAVVAGDLPAIRELICDDTQGVLCPPDDVAALTMAMSALIAAPAKQLALGSAARERIVAEFSDKVNLDRIATALASTQKAVG